MQIEKVSMYNVGLDTSPLGSLKREVRGLRLNRRVLRITEYQCSLGMDQIKKMLKKESNDRVEYLAAQRIEEGQPVLYIRKVRAGTNAIFFD